MFTILLLLTSLSSAGVKNDHDVQYQWGVDLLADSVTNLDGGLTRETETVVNLDLTFKLALNKKTEFYFDFLANNGSNPNQNIGDYQISSNIDVGESLKVYQAWFKHQLTEHLDFTFGVQDLNSSFYILDSASTLINSSFGIGIDASQIAPSIFPTTALGSKFQYQSGNNYLQLAIFDGIPGDPGNNKGTHIKLSSEDGIFTIVEAGLHSSARKQKLGFGIWYSSAETQSTLDSSAISYNHGLYLIGETAVSDNTQAFFQLGHADPASNLVESYLGLGLSSNEVLVSNDAISCGIATAIVNEKALVSKNAEYAFECTYAYPISSTLTIQPDIQYVVNPNFSKNIDDALVLIIRFSLSLGN